MHRRGGPWFVESRVQEQLPSRFPSPRDPFEKSCTGGRRKGPPPARLERLKEARQPAGSGGPAMTRRIFLSYGHDEHVALALRLKQDLEARGHEVWFDAERLKPGADWERYIEEGLEWTAAVPREGRVVLIMTPYSVRRPDGYCLNEIARALSRRLTVVPAMVVWCEPPLSICRIQWLDMRDCVPLEAQGGKYEAKLALLAGALESDGRSLRGRSCGCFTCWSRFRSTPNSCRTWRTSAGELPAEPSSRLASRSGRAPAVLDHGHSGGRQNSLGFLPLPPPPRSGCIPSLFARA